jgi:integrase/recombinase XerD
MFSFSSRLWYEKRRVSKTGLVSIYLQVVINSDHREFPLKFKWPAKFTDLANGQLMPRFKGDPEVNDYNLLIAMEQTKHTDILRHYRIKKEPITIVQFSRELRVFDQKESLVAYMYRHSKFRLSTKEISHRSFMNAQSVIQQMVNFHDTWPLGEVDIKWMKRFKTWLRNKGYAPGGVWSTIKTIKAYARFILHEPMMYIDPDVPDFPNPLPKWETTYLNRDELSSLLTVRQNTELSEKERKILNAFLFQCFTSLRISDIYRINAKWQLSENMLHFIPKKNEKLQRWLSIPLTEDAKLFVKNMTGNYFELPNSVEYNLILKELARKAGINKRLTSHVGRHTFGYMHITSGGDIKSLKEVLGHSKLETTDRYAHLDDEFKLKNASRMHAEFMQYHADKNKIAP